MNRRYYLKYGAVLTTLTLMLTLAWSAGSSQAHGTNISYQPTTAIKITAQFDTGEPMPQAQIIIYAPNDPSTPWRKGQADDKGEFFFVPDTTITGDWAVSVRTAGHGEMLHIPISADQTIPINQSGPNSMQMVLMGLAGVWGFVGTALFFSRRKPTHAST